MTAISDYCDKNNLFLSEFFFRAYKKEIHAEPTLEEQNQIRQDIAAYRVHGTIPIYISLFLTE